MTATGPDDATDDPFALTETAIPVESYASLDGTSPDAKASDLMRQRTALMTRLDDQERRSESDTVALLVELCGVADAVERLAARTVRSVDSDDPTGEHAAVVTIGKLLRRVLTGRGARREQLVGQVADPELVSIERSVPDPELPDETVVQEIRPAYTRNGAVLRQGIVVVSERVE